MTTANIVTANTEVEASNIESANLETVTRKLTMHAARVYPKHRC